MATARLTDSQKQELVRRFRQGESTLALADHFGCSTTTITRLVRAELGPEDYGALRDQRQRKAGRDRQIPLAIDGEAETAATEPEMASPEPLLASPGPEPASSPSPPEALEAMESEAEEEVVPPAVPDRLDSDALRDVAEPTTPPGRERPLRVLEATIPIPAEDDNSKEADDTTVLAIDDADDFSADDDSDDDLLSSEEDGDEEDGPFGGQDFHPVAVLPILVDDQHETRPAPWTPDRLPSCAYLLVDKTVELQARSLADIPELGRLPAEEQDQQALVLFTNPRQAKRQCGRTQRVIKLPDPALLGRTAPYLRAQGISRVVIEGALYALPGG
ncbi:MAG: helix-turn-helix domain-containing protein [Cyanobacteriota bacterium]